MTQETPLGSKYVMRDRIGQGASGVVYAGGDSEGRDLAFKVLREDLADDASVVSSFVRERGTLTSIDSPHVVKVHDLVVEGRTLAIVMERVRGGDLRRALTERGTLTPQEVAAFGAQIARGLGAVHERGIVHRDIKPENVLLHRGDHGPQAKVTDFGISEIAETSQATRTATMKGTINYVAPEVFQGAPTTPKTDVYALGILLYELACGVTPFQGGADGAVMNRHLNLRPGRPPGIPAELWRPIAHMLEKDPLLRPSTDQVVDQLEVVAAQVAGTSPLPALTEPLPGPPADTTRPLTQETHLLPGSAGAGPAHDPSGFRGAHGEATPGASVAHASGGSHQPPRPPRRTKGRGGCLALGGLGILLVAGAAIGLSSALGDDEDTPTAQPTAQVTDPQPAEASAGDTPGSEQNPTQDAEPSTSSPDQSADPAAPSTEQSREAGGTATGPVPDLVGLTVAEAEGALHGTTISKRPHLILPWQENPATAGEVVGQEPEAGATATGVVRLDVAQEPVQQYLADTPQPEGWQTRAPIGDVTVNGERYANSVRMNGLDGTMEWNLERGFRWLAFGASRTDSAAESGTKVQIEVFGDDKKLWSEKVGLGELKKTHVDVTDVLRLRVEYHLLTDNYVSADAALTEPTLYGAQGEAPGSDDE